MKPIRKFPIKILITSIKKATPKVVLPDDIKKNIDYKKSYYYSDKEVRYRKRYNFKEVKCCYNCQNSIWNGENDCFCGCSVDKKGVMIRVRSNEVCDRYKERYE